MQRITTLGICGGIGSGKSTRLKHLVKWWDATGSTKYPAVAFKTIDADVVGHRCYDPGSDTYNKVVGHFAPYGGICVSDTEETQTPPAIDRKKLGAIVFASKERMSELNHIVWPAIAHTIAKEIEVTAERQLPSQQDGDENAGKKQHLVYAIEAAILPHMREMLDMCDQVWMFHANEEAAVRRIMQRNNLTQEEAVKRVNAQSKMEEKVRLIADANKGLKVFDTSLVESDEELEKDLAQVVSDFEELLTKKKITVC